MVLGIEAVISVTTVRIVVTPQKWSGEHTST